jgi:hypothetical protein
MPIAVFQYEQDSYDNDRSSYLQFKLAEYDMAGYKLVGYQAVEKTTRVVLHTFVLQTD